MRLPFLLIQVYFVQQPLKCNLQDVMLRKKYYDKLKLAVFVRMVHVHINVLYTFQQQFCAFNIPVYSTRFVRPKESTKR